jgi:DNA-directed RNA polymerase specialized sigma24 family protein
MSEWAAYLATRSLANRNRVCELYLHLPDKVVAVTFKGAVRAGAANYVNADDLAAAGMIGLIKGVETYDPTRKGANGRAASPETWLCQKIKSYILDDLRRLDHLSRGDRKLVGRGDDGFDFKALTEKGIAPEKAARIVRGERMGAALPFSRLEVKRPVLGPGATSCDDTTIAEAWRVLFKGIKFQKALALVLQRLEGFNALETAKTLGYASRPKWLHDMFKKESVPSFSLERNCHTSRRYRWHAEKRPTFQAFLRKRPSARSTNGSLPTRT